MCFEVLPDCGNESQETIELRLRVPIFYSTFTVLRPAINGDFYRFPSNNVTYVTKALRL